MTEIPRPLPDVTGDMAPFWAAAKRHELVVQSCAACGAHRFPARDTCSQCLSREAAWVPVSGRGTIFSVAIMHQQIHPAFEVPYAVVVVELDEGTRLISNVVGLAPHDVQIGQPVEVVFEEASPDVTLPKFRPRG